MFLATYSRTTSYMFVKVEEALVLVCWIRQLSAYLGNTSGLDMRFAIIVLANRYYHAVQSTANAETRYNDRRDGDIG